MSTAAEIYRATRKVPDLPWNTYVCRPLAALVVAAVQDTRVTPNQITLAAMAVAMASGALLVFAPGHWGLVGAVGLFELSYVLDCADGMLARHRGGGSTEGHLLDFLMDELKAFLILAASSTRLWLTHGRDDTYLLVGLVGVVALASGTTLTTFMRRPEIASPRPEASGEARRPRSLASRAIGLGEAIARQLIHYPSYLLLVAAYGDLRVYVYPYVVVNAAYAVRALLQVSVRFGRR